MAGEDMGVACWCQWFLDDVARRYVEPLHRDAILVDVGDAADVDDICRHAVRS